MIPGHVWSGNFPKKIYIFEHRYMVRRYSWGWGWVRMDAGGCISTQQTQKKGLEGAQDIIVGNHVRGGTWIQRWRGRHLITTEYPGFLWRRKGCGRRDICIHKKRETANAQETTSKKYKQTNPSATRKWSKRKTNIKCLKKERKREQRKENKKQNTKIYSSKLQCKKTGAQQEQRTAQNGDSPGTYFHQNLRQQTVQWWNGWNKIVKAKTQPRQKRINVENIHSIQSEQSKLCTRNKQLCWTVNINCNGKKVQKNTITLISFSHNENGTKMNEKKSKVLIYIILSK